MYTQEVYEKKKHFCWAKCRKQFGQKISEMSSVQPAQTNERTANVVIDSWGPFQTQLNNYALVQQNLQQITESTPLWDIRMKLHLKKISKYMQVERVLSCGICFVV